MAAFRVSPFLSLFFSPNYPCDMVTILHLVLYKTADLEYKTRERAIHLLQILDRRYIIHTYISM